MSNEDRIYSNGKFASDKLTKKRSSQKTVGDVDLEKSNLTIRNR